jgi:hypothetical protein
LLRSIPPLHAVRVGNRSLIVNDCITQLIKRGHLRPHQFRFKKMSDDSCLIFHYSIRDFGDLVKSTSIRTQLHNWDSIFNSIPVGYGCEIDANPKSVHWAIWQYVRRGKLQQGEFRLLKEHHDGKTRMILCHQSRFRKRT